MEPQQGRLIPLEVTLVPWNRINYNGGVNEIFLDALDIMDAFGFTPISLNNQTLSRLFGTNCMQPRVTTHDGLPVYAHDDHHIFDTDPLNEDLIVHVEGTNANDEESPTIGKQPSKKREERSTLGKCRSKKRKERPTLGKRPSKKRKQSTTLGKRPSKKPAWMDDYVCYQNKYSR